jgi:hypothetical protein
VTRGVFVTRAADRFGPVVVAVALAVAIAITTAIAYVLSEIVGAGDAPERTVHRYMATFALGGAIANALIACGSLGLPAPARRWLWLLPSLICGGLTALAAFWVYHSPQETATYLNTVVPHTHIYVASQNPGFRHFRDSKLLAAAAPVAALVATGFRRGASRVFVVATGIASIGWLGALGIWAATAPH